jgi:hypothetical protein
MSLLSELLTTVSSLGGGTVGTDLFGQTLPVSPVVGTAVILTGGFFSADNPTRKSGFQIVHRNTHLSSGTTFVTSIHGALANAWNILPTILGRVEAVNEPGAYAYSADRRALFSLNFFITRFGA